MFRMGLMVALMLWVTGVSEAARLEIVRDEFPINELTTRLNQDHATVAMDGTGRFMATWHSWGGIDGDGLAVLARSFDSAGLPLGAEFIVNTTTSGDQRVPAIASAGGDHYVIAWSSGTDAAGYDVLAKVVSSDGVSRVDEFRVNVTASMLRTWPDVAAFPNGDFLVVWDQVEPGALNFYARLFDAMGQPLTAAMRLNDTPSVTPSDNSGYGLPEVSVSESGAAMAVWEQLTPSGSVIIGRKFFPYLGTMAGEGVIDTPAAGFVQRRPTVDLNAAEDILVTWIELPAAGGNQEVYVKKYDASIAQWRNRIRPYANTANNQHRSAALLTTGGEFVVAWTNSDPVYKDDVYMRFYDSQGLPLLSREILVNTLIRGDLQRRPALALAEGVGLVTLAVTWEGIIDGLDIFGKLYRAFY